MNKIKAIVESNKKSIEQLCAEYGMEKPRIFGSVLHSNSEPNDIDLLVKPMDGTSYFDLVNLAEALEALLGVKFDIVSENGLSPYLKDDIIKKAVPL